MVFVIYCQHIEHRQNSTDEVGDEVEGCVDVVADAGFGNNSSDDFYDE